MALSSGIGDGFDHFIVIFPGAFEYHDQLLSPVIHEMAHILDSATATTSRFQCGAYSRATFIWKSLF